MSNIIDDLYYGNYTPDSMTRMKYPCYAEGSQRMDKLVAQLEERLSPDEIKLLHTYIDVATDIWTWELRCELIQGFRLGAQMMLDIQLCPTPNIDINLSRFD